MAGLRDKVVIITGASSGIGAETAVEFARHGSHVVLVARRVGELEKTADMCNKAGLDRDKILVIPADLMNDDDLKHVIEKTVTRFKYIDVLVNNAGVAVATNTFETSIEDFDKMFKINTRAVFLLSKLALPYILERKGNIVNVSSIAGLAPLTYVSAYSVAKAAQNQLTKLMSLELGPKGVRVNAVCPGTVKTDIFSISGYDNTKSLQEVFDDLASIHPLKRIGTTDEIAKAIVFLASDDASFITGVTLPVDGGRSVTTMSTL